MNNKIIPFFLTLLMAAATTAAVADGCYICKSGSKDGIQQCKYHGSDTQSQRKTCKQAGCAIGGTASCSTAANVKVIDPN